MNKENLIEELKIYIAKIENNQLEELKKLITTLLNNTHSKPLTTAEICEKHQISRRTISRKVRSGELVPISNHGKYMFDEGQIRNWNK